MDIHKPKAAHDWREFLIEIGTIICGILIALGLEQAVQALEWRHKIELAEEAMASELGDDNGPQVYQRAILDACLQTQLDQIRRAVEDGADRATVWRAVDGYKIQFLTYDSLALNAANAAGVTAHMSRDKLQTWIDLYSGIPSLDTAHANETHDLAILRSIRSVGGQLTQAEGDRVLQAVEALRNDEARIMTGVRWFLPHLAHAHIPLGEAHVRRLTTWARHRYDACLKDLPHDWSGPKDDWF